MMDGRRWSEGLHQAVEAKEGVEIEPENQTLASITFQNYFRMYPKLVGHDRHRRDRGGGILRHLQDERRLDPDPHAGPARRRRRRILQEPGGQVRRDRRGDQGEAGRSASRSWSAPSRSRSRNCSPNISRRQDQARGAERPLSTSRRPISSPRRAGSARSPSPPTWPAAAPTSSSAAISSSASPTSSPRWSRGRRATRREREDPRRGRRGEGAGDRRRRPVRARHRAPREPAHRQPAARPRRPPGRSGPQPLLSRRSTTICCASSARRPCSRG